MSQILTDSVILNGGEQLKVFRDGAVTYVDGKPVRQEGLAFPVTASVQPLDGRDLLIVPEGDRFKEQYWVYNLNLLQVNDRVVRNNVNFQVQVVENWLKFQRAKIVRVDTGVNSSITG